MPCQNDAEKFGPWNTGRAAVQRYFRHNMPVYAAALVFHLLLSIFPVSPPADGTGELPQPRGAVRMEQIGGALTLSATSGGASGQGNHELRPLHGGILSFSAAASLWLASRATRAVIQAMNVAYEVAIPRPAWKRYLVSLVHTVGLLALLTAAAVLMASGPTVLEWLSRLFGLEDSFVRVWTWLRWPAAVVLLACVVAIIYYVAPNVCHEFRFVTVGSVLCVSVWGVASFGLRLYVTHVALYHKSYGGVGAIILLLVYLYLAMVSLLFGAEVNAVLEARRRSQGREPGIHRKTSCEH